MAARQPSSEEIRSELERVLSSRSFAQTERHRRFLQFIVEQTLTGNSDRLKGFSIALDVFDRPDDFDPQSDPLVRVEAGRLRKRLVEYYAEEGVEDPVRIRIPRGSYQANFEYAGSDSFDKQFAAVSVGGFRRRTIIGGSALAFALAAVIWLVTQEPGDTSLGTEADAGGLASGLPDWPRVFVAPFSDLSPDGDFSYFAYGITEEISWRLRDFELLVIVTEAFADNDPRSIDAAQVREDSGARYALIGSVRRTGGDLYITARLVDTESGAQIWTQRYEREFELAGLLEIQKDIAQQVVSAIAEPYGPIYESEYARLASQPPATLGTYECVLQYIHYRLEVEWERNQEIQSCFEDAVEAEPGFANAWAGLSLLEVEEYFFGPDILSGSTALLDSAEEHARRALDIDGNSYLAHLAMMRLRFMQRDLEGFERSAERVMELRPTDPLGLYTIAAYWSLIGKTDESAEVRRQLLQLVRGEPRRTLYITGTAIALSEADYAGALEQALRVDTPTWFVGALLEAASAALAGRTDIAARSYIQMVELSPGIVGNEETFFRRLNVSDQLSETLLTGLRLAEQSAAQSAGQP